LTISPKVGEPGSRSSTVSASGGVEPFEPTPIVATYARRSGGAALACVAVA
jgi:hypothetical protein